MKSHATAHAFDTRSAALLVLFLAVVVGAGIFIGFQSAPGAWYESLRRPVFTPPDWVFAPAWTFLYICIALAGWRTFLREPAGAAMALWLAQMALNWLWSPVFFVLHLPWPAFAVLVAMLALVLTFAANRWTEDRLSAILFLPYAAWLSYAGALNLAIAILNS